MCTHSGIARERAARTCLVRGSSLAIAFDSFPTRRGGTGAMLGLASSVFLVCVASVGSAHSFADVGSEGLLPHIDVSLDPPVGPLPAIAARIAKFEDVREMQQATRIENINRKFNALLADASARIDSVVARSHSKLVSDGVASGAFLQTRSHALLDEDNVAFVSVRAHPAGEVDDAVLDDVAEFENGRDTQEDAWFGQAAAELQSLSDMLMAEAEAALHGGAAGTSQAFMQYRTAQVHDGSMLSSEDIVHIVPSTQAFPTAQSMVADMEARREVSEDFERATMLHLQMMLVDAEVMLLHNALLRETAVDRAHSKP